MNFPIKIDGKVTTFEASKLLQNTSPMHNISNEVLQKIILVARNNADQKKDNQVGNLLHKMAQKFSCSFPGHYHVIHITKEEASALKKYLSADFFIGQKKELTEHLLKEADFVLKQQ